MQLRHVAGALMLVVAAVAAAENVRPLVLVGGTTVAMQRAELRGDMVWVWTDRGVLQAYPAQEVDLGASGLLPEPAPTPAADADKQTSLGVPPRLQDARAEGDGSSAMRITDADVEHVAPAEDTPAEDPLAAVGGGPFPLTALRHTVLGERVTVTGSVTNNSPQGVESLRIHLVAMDAAGVSLGRGSTLLRRSLGPGGSSPFEVVIPGVKGQVHRVEGVAGPGGRGGDPGAYQAPRPPAPGGGR